jgi:hypothetical protein
MIEAAPSIPLQPSAVIVTLARQAALKAVKQLLRDRGLKLSRFSLRDLKIMANNYMTVHRTRLLAETWQGVRNAPAL